MTGDEVVVGTWSDGTPCIDDADPHRSPARAALIKGGARTREEIDRYLPPNYATVVVESYGGEDDRSTVLDGDRFVRLAVVGVDVAGWTLDGYVIPRLASGLIWAEEGLGDLEVTS